MTTLSDFLKHPAEFLYIFMTDDMLSVIDAKHAKIIAKKRQSQRQLLVNAVGADQYQNAINQLKQAMISAYGYTPYDILVKLARGEEVAGKNWSKGIYGIGATTQQTFSNTPGSSAVIKVRESDGQFVTESGSVLTTIIDSYTTAKGGGTVPGVLKYTDANGNIYTAVYDKKTGKYVAGQYSQNGGKTYSASGQETTAADSSSIWEGLALAFNKILDWLISLFTPQDREKITTANTVPNQLEDGWVTDQQANIPWYLIAAGGIAVLAAGGFSKFWSGAKKGKKKK